MSIKREDLHLVDFSDVAKPGAKSLPTSHPGVHLEDYLDGAGITQYRLAKNIKVPARRINEIVHRRRAITADTALRLGVFFETSAEFWMNLQTAYDLDQARGMVTNLSDIKKHDEAA